MLMVLASIGESGFPLSAAVIPPVLILVLCVAAGVGTVLLLPSRRDMAWRKVGAIVVLAAALIFAALLVRATADVGGMGVYFWVFSAIALAGALRVITHSKPVYSALYFVLTVLASAGLFVLLWAEFMAAALILIYAGAILVTYVFVIMLAAEAAPSRDVGRAGETAAVSPLAEHDAVSREPLVACSVGFALMGILLFVIFERAEGVAPVAHVTESPAVASAFVPQGSVQQLGNYLFTKHLVNLELAGLILTVAMVGAIIIARRRVVAIESSIDQGEAEMASATATPIDDNPHSIPVYGTENPRQKEYPET